MPESLDSLPLWYCATYPVDAIQFSSRQEMSHKIAHLPALLEDIRQRGMVNPLIVLNHRDPTQWRARWCMTGTNRLWVARQLGWKTVQALVTGRVDDVQQFVSPMPLRDLAHAQQFFKDGELYWGRQGPRIRGYSNFVKGEFPREDGKQGVGTNV